MTIHQPLISLRAELASGSEGTPELDRCVAYAVGLGDPTSRMMFEEYGPDVRHCRWFPGRFSTIRDRAVELLPEGRDWDRRAEGLTALELCGLALEAREAGLRPRHIERTTSGQWYEGREISNEAALKVQAAKRNRSDARASQPCENGSGEGKRPQVAPR